MECTIPDKVAMKLAYQYLGIKYKNGHEMLLSPGPLLDVLNKRPVW